MNTPANDPALRSWVDVPANSDFPIQNLHHSQLEANILFLEKLFELQLSNNHPF